MLSEIFSPFSANSTGIYSRIFSKDYPDLSDTIEGMMKKILTYGLMFVVFFLCGMVIAFGWKKYVSSQQTVPPQTAAPSPVSRPTHTTHVAVATQVRSTITATYVQISQPSSQSSATMPPVVPTKPAQPAATGHDIILLLDSSGSMKRTDPSNYRREAAKLFISLLSKDDRIGIISFGDSATILMPLTQNTQQNREGLFNALNKISSKEMTTNITEAVQKGFDQVRPSQQKKVLLMLSDGKLDLGSPEKDASALARLNQLVIEVAKEIVNLYTMAFTAESDSALLETLAKETGGLFRYAREDRDVHRMFAAIFERIKSPDTVPLEGETFTIDSQIREATVLVSKKPGIALSLIDPSNRKYTKAHHAPAMAWFESSVFDMITIQEPPAGTWRVKLSVNEGNKVYILTHLNLKTSFDRSFVTRGERIPIEAWLEKQGGIVTEKDVLAITVFSAEMTGPDNKVVKLDLAGGTTSTAAQPGSGKYSAQLQVTAAGDHTLRLSAQGKTFTREKTFLFRAVEPIAVPQAERPLVQRQAQSAATDQHMVSWTAVLIQFLIVNIVIIALTATLYFIRNVLSRRRKRHDNH
jgi:Mg-chelatase subunit ChlD